MTIPEILAFEIPPEELAEAEAIGGVYDGRWSGGACWPHEGMFLYRTVRATQPHLIVEVGRLEGCSTTHLAMACKHNAIGRVVSIDVNPDAGAKIPDDLRMWVDLVTADAAKLQSVDELVMATGNVARFDAGIDLLLEDGAHTPGFTAHVLRTIAPARRVLVHDFWTNYHVADDCRKVFGDPHEVYYPHDRKGEGYAIYRFDQ